MFESKYSLLSDRLDSLHRSFPRTKSFRNENEIIRRLLREVSIEEVSCRRLKLETIKYKELVEQIEKYYQFFEEHGFMDGLKND